MDCGLFNEKTFFQRESLSNSPIFTVWKFFIAIFGKLMKAYVQLSYSGEETSLRLPVVGIFCMRKMLRERTRAWVWWGDTKPWGIAPQSGK